MQPSTSETQFRPLLAKEQAEDTSTRGFSYQEDADMENQVLRQNQDMPKNTEHSFLEALDRESYHMNDELRDRYLISVPRWTRITMTAIALVLGVGFILQGILLLTVFDPEPGLRKRGELSKRDGQTGAIIGGCVGGTVVLIIILSVCFYQMCDRVR